MKGSRGARVSICAVTGVGGAVYTTTHMSLVSYRMRTPLTAKQAIDLWLEIKELRKVSRRSNLHKSLRGGTHVQKVVQTINHRYKANVVLFPPSDLCGGPKLEEFFDELCEALVLDPTWETHQKWLLHTVEGGIWEQPPVPKEQRLVNHWEQDISVGWGMIQAWLEANMPITGLRQWLPREEYMAKRTERIEKGRA